MTSRDGLRQWGGFLWWVRGSRAAEGLTLVLALALTLLLAACSLGEASVSRSATATATPAATRTPLPQITPPLTFAQMAYDSHSGTIVLFGSQATPAPSQATWIWDGAGWHPVRTASAPDNSSRNAGSTITYDSTHNQIIFFEYVNATAQQATPQTWTFDGGNWTHHTASPVAPPLDALLADDPAGGGVVAFGGITGSISGEQPLYSSATWRWDGARWTQLHPAAAPTTDDAQFGAMITDTQAKQVVLVNQHTGEVWTWDGATWTAHQPTSAPPARDSAVLVFDGKSQSVMLLNGYIHTTGRQTGDMWQWQWKGSAWSQLSVTGTPTTLEPESVVYDAQMQALVAYVVVHSPPESQTWIWDGGGAWRELV